MRFLAIGLLTSCAVSVALTAASSSNAGPSRSARTIVISAGVPRGQMRAAAVTRGPAPVLQRRRPFDPPRCSGVGVLSFVGGGSSNFAAGDYSGVLSGSANDACEKYSGIGAGISNGTGGSNWASFIGAGALNAVMNAQYGFIGAGTNNTVSNGLAFVGAGAYNTVSNLDGFVGAGDSNHNSGQDAVIVGGKANTVSNADGFIGGGTSNVLAGPGAVIGGGSANRAPGQYATIPGGYSNYAGGLASFAGGNGAAAVTTGAFVWSDSAGGKQLVSSASNQFLAKASGGVKFFSNSSLTTGVMLGAGSGTWASVSDRAVKTNVAAIDEADILDKVASLPISEWSYISERGVRHVGPMAQDFYAAFGVGADNKHITSIDEDGVALAAIKALNSRLAQKDAALRSLQQEVRKLDLEVNHLSKAR